MQTEEIETRIKHKDDHQREISAKIYHDTQIEHFGLNTNISGNLE